MMLDSSQEALRRFERIVRAVHDPLDPFLPSEDRMGTDEITRETSFDELGLDDVDFACFIMDAEKEFGVELTEEAILEVLATEPTVGTLISKIEQAKAGALRA